MNADEEIQRLKTALAFYADPETYHAILFLGDAPCGEFMDDLSDNHGHVDYDRPMPGARAREALGEFYVVGQAHVCDERCNLIDFEAHKAFASEDGKDILIGLTCDEHPAKRMILKADRDGALEVADLIVEAAGGPRRVPYVGGLRHPLDLD